MVVRCPGFLTLKGFLLLMVLDNKNIAYDQENITGIECEVEILENWHRYNWDRADKTSIKCNVQCSPKCTCTLDDVKVARNCTSDNVTVYPVIYPSDNTRYLNWNNSVLHNIKPGAFWRFGSALESLHLTNISLQHLQLGVFAGLTGVTDLDLSFNRIHKISAGAFRELVNLTRLELDRNVLTEIPVGVFRGLIRLEELDLSSNRLNRIAEGAFEDLEQLQKLQLNNNRLSEISVGVFRGLTELKQLIIDSNRLNMIAECAFEDLVQLRGLWLKMNRLSEINIGVFRGLMRLTGLDLTNNSLTRIVEDAFEDLEELRYLWLLNNSLSEIDVGVFRGLIRLEYIDLHNNNLNRIANGAFEDLVELKQLDLRGNPLLWIETHALSDINDTVILAVTEYATCCFTTANCSSSSPSPYLTCKRLLPYDLLRIAIWFVCSFAIVGNIFVFCTRFKNTRQKENVQFLLIMNLSISDFIMGIYLIILLSADLYYIDNFPCIAFRILAS